MKRLPFSILNNASLASIPGTLLIASFTLVHSCLASEDIRSYVVKVYGASAPGSGVVVDSDSATSIILTAAHVIKDTTEKDLPYVLTGDGKRLDIVGISKSATLDLAQLTVKASLKAAPLYRGVHHGGGITLAGFAHDSLHVELKEGTSEPQGFSIDVRPGGYSILHSANSRIGFSGGGIFNVAGELVGIHGQADTSKLTSGRIIKTGIALAIPVSFWLADSVQRLPSANLTSRTDLLSRVSFLRSSHKPREALDLIKQAIGNRLDDFSLLLLKASLQMDLSRASEALITLKNAEILAPENPAVLANTGNAYFMLQDYHNALLYYDKSSRMAGSAVVEVSINKAKALVKLNRQPEALSVLDEVVKGRSAHAVFERARLLYDMKRYSESLEDLKLYSQSYPYDANMLSLTGLVYGMLGDKRASHQYLSQALGVDPNNRIHILNHAVSLGALGEHNQSIRILRDLLSRHPDLNDAAANIAEILYWAGQKNDACEEAARLVEIGYQWHRGSWDQGFVAECSLDVETTQNSGPP